jgi:selenide,water dikinase
VGGGHAHVEVLRRWARRPPRNASLTVVLDQLASVYSGMVPGLVAREYTLPQLLIDVGALAERAGATVVPRAATSVDPDARLIHVEHGEAIPYDVASLDVGSSVRGLDVPGAREHALATRPIGEFTRRIDKAAGAGLSLATIAVVGGGAAGVELGFALRARWRRTGVGPRIVVLADTAEVLPAHSEIVRKQVLLEARKRGVRLRRRAEVTAVEEGVVHTERESIRVGLIVWATGAAPPPLLRASPLPRDDGGFVRVRASLQVTGHDELFAAGDCAGIEGAEWVPKSGVYAVRMGPVLDANIRAFLRGRRLRRFRPQRRALAILNLGDGAAIAIRRDRVLVGRWVRRWKDFLDRRFVARYR